MRDRLQQALGRARGAIPAARRRGDSDAERAAQDVVGIAKRGLGERGTPWWDQPLRERRRRWQEALRHLSHGK